MIKKLTLLAFLFLTYGCQNQDQAEHIQSVNSESKQDSVISKALCEKVQMISESDFSGYSYRMGAFAEFNHAWESYDEITVKEVIEQLKKNSVHCLCFENMGTEATKLACQALQTVTNPVRLFVVNPNREQIILIAELVKKNASLSFVNIICNSRLDNKSAKAFSEVFCEALKVNTKLKNFCFEGYLDNESAKALGKALRFNTSLRYFIWKDGKDSKSAKLLLNELKNSKSLEAVRFVDSCIDDDGIIAISDWIKANPALEFVGLRYETISVKGIKALVEAINASSLWDLNLSKSKIDDDGIEALANGLKYNKTLKQLEIPRNYHDEFNMPDIGPKGINALVDMRKANETVYIQLGPKDYETLEKALKDSKISEHKIHTIDTFS